jgi:hypothetical protein
VEFLASKRKVVLGLGAVVGAGVVVEVVKLVLLLLDLVLQRLALALHFFEALGEVPRIEHVLFVEFLGH